MVVGGHLVSLKGPKGEGRMGNSGKRVMLPFYGLPKCITERMRR